MLSGRVWVEFLGRAGGGIPTEEEIIRRRGYNMDKIYASCAISDHYCPGDYCARIAYDYWDFDCSEAAHGRALAVATAIKRIRKDNIIFTYQGDGDLAAIGANETIHAANRGENITVVFINNGVYGMTGGQMAPTTLLNQKTATTVEGRDAKIHGFPLKISEMLAFLPGVTYIERTSLHSPQEIIKVGVKQAFSNQIEGLGFSLVEILSPCPTYWGMTPRGAPDWVRDGVLKEFPLGRIK